jgi:hypothetical protein
MFPLPWQTTPCYQLGIYTMKVTMPLSKLTASQFSTTKKKAILKGNRDLGTGLWRINLRKDKPQIQIAAANNMYQLCNTGTLVNYLHNSMFIPTKAAFIESVKQGHLTAWPGLTEEAINKHLKLTP